MLIADHQWCFEQARIVLRNDRRPGLKLVDQFAGEIIQGLEEADTGLGIMTPYGNIPAIPVMHFLNPHTNMGLGGWISVGWGTVTNAALFCDRCVDIARRLWLEEKNQSLAMVVFGVGLHLVHDLTVPHHARLKVLSFHSDYEHWLHANIKNTAVIPKRRGIYARQYPSNWVYANARESYDLFPYCDGVNPRLLRVQSWTVKKDNLPKVRDAMVPLAIRTTAGFIDNFLAMLD